LSKLRSASFSHDQIAISGGSVAKKIGAPFRPKN